MIQIFTNAPESAKQLIALSEALPKEFPTAFKTMGQHYRNRIKKDMTAGTVPGGTAPLNPNTIELKKGRKNSKGFGGRIRQTLISKVSRNPLELSLGFLASQRAQKFALSMMTARSYNYSDEARRSLFARARWMEKEGGGKGKRQSRALIEIAKKGHRQPQREFIAPYISIIQREMPEKISQIIGHLIERRLKRK